MTATATETRRYSYHNSNQQWFDQQSRRYISRNTLIKRTGLSLRHVTDFENGRDGYGYTISRADRVAAEEKLGVSLS